MFWLNCNAGESKAPFTDQIIKPFLLVTTIKYITNNFFTLISLLILKDKRLKLGIKSKFRNRIKIQTFEHFFIKGCNIYKRTMYKTARKQNQRAEQTIKSQKDQLKL